MYPFEPQQLRDGDALCDFLGNNIPQALDLLNGEANRFYNTSPPGALLH